jgi:hypothetical protein
MSACWQLAHFVWKVKSVYWECHILTRNSTNSPHIRIIRIFELTIYKFAEIIMLLFKWFDIKYLYISWPNVHTWVDSSPPPAHSITLTPFIMQWKVAGKLWSEWENILMEWMLLTKFSASIFYTLSLRILLCTINV